MMYPLQLAQITSRAGLMRRTEVFLSSRTALTQSLSCSRRPCCMNSNMPYTVPHVGHEMRLEYQDPVHLIPSSESILSLSSFDTGSYPISLTRPGVQYQRITA